MWRRVPSVPVSPPAGIRPRQLLHYPPPTTTATTRIFQQEHCQLYRCTVYVTVSLLLSFSLFLSLLSIYLPQFYLTSRRIPQSHDLLPLSSPFRQTVFLFLKRSSKYHKTTPLYDTSTFWSDLNNLLAFNGFFRPRDTRTSICKRKRANVLLISIVKP